MIFDADIKLKTARYVLVVMLMLSQSLAATIIGRELQVEVSLDREQQVLSITNTGDFDIRYTEVMFFPSITGGFIFNKDNIVSTFKLGTIKKDETIKLPIQYLLKCSPNEVNAIGDILVGGQYAYDWRTKKISLTDE